MPRGRLVHPKGVVGLWGQCHQSKPPALTLEQVGW